MKAAAITATLALALSNTAQAQDWLDDFSDGSAVDGSPVVWVQSPAFGAAFEVVDGDLLISIDTPGDAISSPRVASYFDHGVSVRARMVAIDGPGRYTVAFADEPTGIQGYVASFSTCGGGRVELFRGDTLGGIVHLGTPVPMPYSPVDGDFYVQLDVREGIVSARVWRPGEPFPEPQISALDTHYSAGVPSIAIQDFGDGASCGSTGDRTNTTTIVRFAQASATPLTHASAADINADGLTDGSDFFAYLDLFAAGELAADLDGDGDLDADDFFTYLDRFAQG